jgi:hypothetical protein
MSSLVLTGDTSGQVTLAAPAVAGTSTLTLQAATATNSVNTLGTAVTLTTQATIDFTNLPSWVKRITIMFAGVSTNGTDSVLTLLGTGATPTYATSGYSSAATYFLASTIGTNTLTTGFLTAFPASTSTMLGGHVNLTNVSGNTWTFSCAMGDGAATRTTLGGGYITLGAVLTAVRISLTASNTFDAGTINILYEG